MKFRFYLVDSTGEVTGTDKESIAIQASDIYSSGYVAVIDAEAGKDMACGENAPEIAQQLVYKE